MALHVPDVLNVRPDNEWRCDVASNTDRSDTGAYPRIQWEKTFETGHDGIDTEHRRLVRLLDRLCAITPAPGDELKPMLDELLRYTEYHFEHESQLMTEFGVSDAHAQAHRLAHSVFVSKIKESVRAAEHDPASVSADMLTYLGRWLLTHIMGMDRDLVHEMSRRKPKTAS